MRATTLFLTLALAVSAGAQKPATDGSECNNGQGVGQGNCGDNGNNGGGGNNDNSPDGNPGWSIGWGDPYYYSFDRLYLHTVGGSKLVRWQGKQLLSSTCGTSKQSNFKLWGQTGTWGLNTAFDIEFEKRWGNRKVNFAISFSAKSPYLRCEIGGTNYGSDHAACRNAAKDYGVHITSRNHYYSSDTITSKAYGTNFNEFRFYSFRWSWRYTYFYLQMDKGMYANRLTGLLGNMNGNSADDGNCYRPVSNLIDCFAYENIKDDKFNFDKKFHWPKQCPSAKNKVPKGKPKKLTKEERKKENAARKFCRFINPRSGVFKGCGTVTNMDMFKTSCFNDYVSTDERTACASARAAADWCKEEAGKTVNLADTACAEYA